MDDRNMAMKLNVVLMDIFQAHKNTLHGTLRLNEATQNVEFAPYFMPFSPKPGHLHMRWGSFRFVIDDTLPDDLAILQLNGEATVIRA